MVYRSTTDPGRDGGGDAFDLDQRTTARAGSRSTRGQRARAASDLHSDRKSDQVDAEKLARYARLDPKILRPISHRTVAQQEALTLIRARNLLVRLRTAAVNAVRGLAKPCGHRLPASSTLCFAKRCMEVLPPGLVQALGPVLEQIASLTVKIKHYDRLVKQLTETEYVETQALIKVYGVGELTALTYVLTLGNKQRFKRSRDVGCYLGLRPRRSQSGDRDPQLGITKAGNVYLRSLLVECGNHVLGPRGKDSTLRRWGLHLAARGGNSRVIEPSLPSHASLPSCSTASGSRSNRTCRSTQKQLKVCPMFNCRHPASR